MPVAIVQIASFLPEQIPVAVVAYFIFTSKWVNEICGAETCNSLE
jgi:hypothetical protein